MAIPAYNEEAIVDFLRELDSALAEVASRVEMCVVDDASTDDTVSRLEAAGPELAAALFVSRNDRNSGHGPTVVRAYRAALDRDTDLVLQVDGDGQFEGRDTHLLVALAQAGADVAVGVRTSRCDPWFRRALSRALRVYLRVLFGVTSADPNCPFRVYRRAALDQLLAQLPPDPLVPTVYLTAAAGRAGVRVVEVPVTHRARRGDSTQGTMWGKRRALLIPRRLIVFVRRAFVESIEYSRSLPQNASGIREREPVRR